MFFNWPSSGSALPRGQQINDQQGCALGADWVSTEYAGHLSGDARNHFEFRGPLSSWRAKVARTSTRGVSTLEGGANRVMSVARVSARGQ